MSKRSLSKDLSLVTIAMMVSLAATKATGFIREILIVPVLGYGINSDAYNIGFQIPDLFYQMLVGGAISAAVTPSLSSAIAKNQAKRFWKSLSTFITVMTLVLIGANILGEIFAPYLIRAYNMKQPAEVVDLAVRVTRALFPQTIFLMLGGLLAGVLYGNKIYHKQMFSTFIYNIVCIFFILYWGDKSSSGPVRVAFGVVIAAFVQFIYVLVRARKEIRPYRPNLDVKDPGFKALVRLAIPTLMSGSVMQINSIIQTHFAHQFQGAVTALRHAQVTRNLPVGIIVVSMTNIILPTLSYEHALKNYKNMRRIYTNGLRRVLFMVMPFILIFVVLSQDTIRAIFQWRGAIPENRIAIEAGLLQIYAFSLIPATCIQVLINAFYARKVTRISVLTSIVSLALNPVLCILFANTLGLGLYGIPIASIINDLIRWAILSTLYKIHIPQARPNRMLPFYLRCLFISLITAIVLMGVNTLPIHPAGKVMQIVVYLGKIGIALITWYFAGIAIGLREAKFIQKEVRRILGFSPVIE
ncbi:MAG: murein biosynthesis integral membrane protein MurJ [Saccharofermentanales bacterium]|jgi:putative peptidoglycan lipid II flippase